MKRQQEERWEPKRGETDKMEEGGWGRTERGKVQTAERTSATREAVTRTNITQRQKVQRQKTVETRNRDEKEWSERMRKRMKWLQQWLANERWEETEWGIEWRGYVNDEWENEMMEGAQIHIRGDTISTIKSRQMRWMGESNEAECIENE